MAQLLTLAVNFMGGKAKPQDFSICHEPPKSKEQKRKEFEAAMRSMMKKGRANEQ